MLNKIKSVVSAVILVIAGFAGTAIMATNVAAEEDNNTDDKPGIRLQISPVSNRVNLEPGETPEFTFTVSNIGSSEFKYTIYAAPYSVKDENYDIDFSSETNRTQITRWIQFKNSEGQWTDKLQMSIKPDEHQKIEYRVNVPKDVPNGGQYAAIFAETEPITASGDNPGAIKTASRAGLIVYGRTSGETRDAAEISDFQFQTLLTSGNVSTSARIKNTGNTDFEAKYSMSIKTLFGKTIYEKENVYNVLPETTRRASMEWGDTPIFGIYRATASVSAVGEVKEESKIVMIIPIFVIIIVLILLTILIAWTIILVKKRNEQKAKLIV
ncbi:hypothetical protein IJ096_03040 [Candidatus Saccharibacteria bacterium]|nr:hypothetical protein [Candidatus Saccharibacteria bacterium]